MSVLIGAKLFVNSYIISSFFRYCHIHFSKVPASAFQDDSQNRERKTVTRTTILPNGQKHEEEVELLTDFSWRNFFSTINFAKIMQKLSKHRSHRIWMLVQYKSSVSSYMSSMTWRLAELGLQAVLKRVLRVSHPMLQLHILKLIKSQVPFCGRKWRQSTSTWSLGLARPKVLTSKLDSQHEGYHFNLLELPPRPARRMVNRYGG